MSSRIFITGANRGLGLELVRQYTALGARIFAAARDPRGGELRQLAQQHPERISLIQLDVTSQQEIQAAVATVQSQTEALDVLINNAAIHPRGLGLGSYEAGPMLAALTTNAVAPVLIAQAFYELLRRGDSPRLINISTQLGSFGFNRDGSSPLYAASKAALNMYTRALAREARGVITVAVHPGWVQTDMGGKDATLTAAESVQKLRTLIGRLTSADNGKFFNHDGQPHPW
jgi:NAD(P)-dependent dehydrogenase (short-subunit alcohol dehydrogenase family)